MRSRFDVVVVGAGTAGCLAALTSAMGGLKVCLVDSKPEEVVGDKVCGDAVGRHHFERLGLPPPRGEELNREIKGVEVYSPDGESCFRVEGEGVAGFMVNRRALGQRLLRLCLDAGVTFTPETVVLAPLTGEGWVKGVSVHDKVKNRKRDLYGGVTVDASGFPAVVRRGLPQEFGVEGETSPSDLMACYREIRGDCDYTSPYCRIHLDQEVAPGGYYWIFPKGGGKVNTGLGVQFGGKGANPRQRFIRVLSSRIFRGSKVLHGGGGVVPTRRPLDPLVANGVVFTGDAAYLVNPIHGGGIGPSMMSGRMAGEAILSAAEEGDYSRESLWGYPQKYNREYGAKQAGLDLFRIFLQATGNEELNYGMKHRLLKEEDVLKVSLHGDLSLSISEKAERVFKGLRKLGFLARLRETARKMRVMKRLYQEYPGPEGLPPWRRRVIQLYR